ncbi:MAG: hypothetical protein ABJL99_19130 [Aliishimia sp.]
MLNAIGDITTLSMPQLIGLGGFLIYIVFFAGLQWGWLDGNSIAFCLGNILAASLVAISLTADFNLASALIQGSWIMIGLTGLILRWLRPTTPHHGTTQ